LLVLVGLATRLAAIPLITIMLVAITSTKLPMLASKGFWAMAHEARTDWSMLLGSVYLPIVGAGAWSLDAILGRSGAARDRRRAPASPGGVRRVVARAGALAILASAGCASLGPRAVERERTDYNFAIQETQDAQLLLNLVRLKYRDTPVFLELGSITSQLTFEGGGEAGAELQKDADLWKLGFSARFSSQPTITYAPLQGERFAQQLLSPLKIETLMLLYRSGWPLKRVLSLCVQRLGRVENAARASGPTPEEAPPTRTWHAPPSSSPT
jgi:hypothetical protein